MGKHIIKTRGRHGTSSLDLTLPSEIKRECNINPGDYFTVEYKKNNKTIEIIYTLIYKQDNKIK